MPAKHLAYNLHRMKMKVADIDSNKLQRQTAIEGNQSMTVEMSIFQRFSGNFPDIIKISSVDFSRLLLILL